MQTKTPGCLKARTKKPQRSTARQLILNKTLLSYSKNTFFECVCGGKAFLEQSAFLYVALCWVGRSALSILTKATEILGPQKPAFTHFMEKETFPSIFFRSVIKYKKNDITIPCQFEKEMPLEKNNVLYL